MKKKNKERLVQQTAYIREDLHNRLKEAKLREGIDMSAVVTRALEVYFCVDRSGEMTEDEQAAVERFLDFYRNVPAGNIESVMNVMEALASRNRPLETKNTT